MSKFEKETRTMSLELKQTLKDLEQKIEDLKGYL
jgi:hypothetical protein